MNYDTLSIRTISEAANLTSQQNIDADIILPDYYDTIGKLLKCEIMPVTEAVTTNGDKISVAGIAKFSMLYIGEDNKIYCYENEYKYTKIFQSQHAENCLSSAVRQNVFSLNYRAIAPKRVELRAVLQIGVKIYSRNDKAMISAINDENIISKTEKISYLTAVNLVLADFSLSGSFPLTDFNDSADIIIRKDSKIKISEVKTIHNKAYIKGLAETEILYYSSETRNAATTVLSLPVSEIIDIFGAEEEDICNISINDIYTEAVIRESGSRSLDVRIDVSIKAQISRYETQALITDLYSVRNEACVVKDCAEIVTASKRISKNESIAFDADIYDDCRFSVIDCWITNTRIAQEKRGNRHMLLVTSLFNALIKNEDGNLSVISREHTFESELICDNYHSVLSNLDFRVLSVSALQSIGGKISFNAELVFEADMLVSCKVTGFTSIEINEAMKCDASSRFTIYFAKQNEEIWAVAKENRTSVDAIKEINNLTGDFISEDKMLLLPSF